MAKNDIVDGKEHAETLGDFMNMLVRQECQRSTRLL